MKKRSILLGGGTAVVGLVLCVIWYVVCHLEYKYDDEVARSKLVKWYGSSFSDVKVIDNWQWERSIDPVRTFVIEGNDKSISGILSFVNVVKGDYQVVESEFYDGYIYGRCVPGYWRDKYAVNDAVEFFTGHYEESSFRIIKLSNTTLIIQILCM